MIGADGLKLTVYFGERRHSNGRFLADVLSDIYAEHALQTSVVMRGAEGFGAKHQLRTDRLLTLSEDLPMVSVAVDTPQRIQAALADLRRLTFSGLVTLERARLLTGDDRDGDVALPGELRDAAKLTVYLGRHERVGDQPAYAAVVAALHRAGVAGASVLLGVDGTAQGVRRRAAFFAANADVPLMVLAVGGGGDIAATIPALARMLPRSPMTLERVVVCKRDGARLAAPRELPDSDPSGLGLWHKLTVYAGEQARHRHRPLSDALVRDLRRAGAAGATSLRGIWGYHGDHAPHGDSFWQLRRRVPVVTVVIDRPERIRQLYPIVDELTEETGLVTSEMIPAFHATGPQLQRGGLRLARGPD